MWIPPDRDQTSSSQPAMQSQAVAPSPMQQPDFRTQYNQILAPYQANAQRIFGGDPVFGNSSFAQNHPTASHIMSNLLLAASKSQPGATVGDSIRIAAGMAMAPHEAWQQQQYNLATAPGKMMAPELQLMQHLSQMNYQNSEIQRNQAYSDYLSGAKTDQANAAANAKRAMVPRGNPIPDDNGILHQPVWNPATNKTDTQPLEPVPDGYQPTFNQYHRGNASGAGVLGSSLEGRVLSMAHPPADPSKGYTPSEATQLLNEHSDIISGVAQNRAQSTKTGEESAPHTHEDTAALIAQTHSGYMKDIPAPQKQTQYHQSYILSGRPLEGEDAAYKKEVTEPWLDQVQKRDDQFNAWRTSDAKKGIPFDRKKDYTSSEGPSTGGSSGLPPVSQFKPNETKWLRNPSNGKVEKYWHNPSTHQVQKVD